MSLKPSRGGEEVVSDVLPDDAFEVLADSIWRVGNLVVPQELDRPYAPSTIYAYERRFGQLALELSFSFAVNDITEAAEPVQYMATLSEVETYMPWNESELWNWRCFTLDTRHRQLWFARGASIMTPAGEVRMETKVSEEKHKSKTGAETRWHSAQQLAVTAMTDDYHWFADALAIITEDLRSDS